jgi:hypothetical protein
VVCCTRAAARPAYSNLISSSRRRETFAEDPATIHDPDETTQIIDH